MLEAELFALFEQTADAAYAVTEDGEICSWNTAAEHLFGYRAADVRGRHIEDVLDAYDTLGTEPLAGGIESASRHWPDAPGGIPPFDLDVRARSGDRLWINVSTIVFDNARTGRRLFIRLARNITQQRHREELFARMLDAARQVVAVNEPAPDQSPTEPLSVQERRILTLFSRGGNPATIARKLKISPQTLRNHLHHINRKLRTHNRLEAVTHAQRRGLID
jgi:PAS domain S-box-containing protein